jgi:hypothetical protein
VSETVGRRTDVFAYLLATVAGSKVASASFHFENKLVTSLSAMTGAVRSVRGVEKKERD